MRNRSRIRSTAAGLLLASLLLGLAACTSLRRFSQPEVEGLVGQPPVDSLAFSLFLIGDAGAPTRDPLEPSLELLRRQLQEADTHSAVVFLGDNIYPSGMPPPSSPERDEAERRMLSQLDAVADYPGRVVVIPGNHDWGGGGLGGDRATLRREELFVEQVLDRGNTFLPDQGFPGPVEVPLTPDITLVVLDTQWWLEPQKIYGDTGQYELEQEGSVLVELHDILRRNADKHLVVAGHHPLFSNGTHGGRFEATQDLYLLYPLSRRYLGTPQDLSNRYYRALRNGLLPVFEPYDGLVYAAGHEHTLQYFHHDAQHYIISGSGSKTSYVAEGHGAAFARSEKGFAVLRYYTDGSVWLEFWAPVGDGKTGRILYGARLEAGGALPGQAEKALPKTTVVAPSDESNGTETFAEVPADPAKDDRPPYPFYSTGTIRVVAGERYGGSFLSNILLGRGYRDLWQTPVQVPVLDLARTADGLTPIKKGGGLQTKSLRLRGGDGDEYVLRLIDKNPALALPSSLRDVIALNFAENQVIGINPYGAFIIPPLAEAAGLYHTVPRLVFIPDDARLGLYRDEFSGYLALLESRPDEDQSDESRFGYAENIIGTPKLYEELAEDNDESVDARAFARARLFDMFVGDWDRHADQWRWAEFKGAFGKRYVPVPRDRDFAFFRFDGPLASVARWSGLPEYQRYSDFGPTFGDLTALNYNGAPLDHRLTAGLTRTDWVEIADSLQAALTDEVIEAAVHRWPRPIFEKAGPFTIRALKARRDALAEVAADYYRLLAHTVEVVGSDKHERFEVTRLEGGRTRLVVYKTKKEGDPVRVLLARTIDPKETKEIRLYGLDGNDQFVLRGPALPGPLIRAIGGPGEDVYLDLTKGATPTQGYFYDSDYGENRWSGASSEAVLSSNPRNNAYLPTRFEQPLRQPLAIVGWNVDEGAVLGGGLRLETHGFRKDPYEAAHRFAARVALRGEALSLSYDGNAPHFSGRWNGGAGATARVVRDYHYYYGDGNATKATDDNRDRFASRLTQVTAYGDLIRPMSRFAHLRFGPRFAYTDAAAQDSLTALTDRDLGRTLFAGVEGAFELDGTDSLAATLAGVRWLNRVSVHGDVLAGGRLHARLSSELSYYYTFGFTTTTTLAARVGVASNVGDAALPFYRANTLGGLTNLRGYRQTRFSGKTSFYANTELRVQLFDVNAYLTRGRAGVLAFLDVGRVWAEDESSDAWHAGAGGGLWITPIYNTVLTATLARSAEDLLFSLRLGFFF